MRLLPFDLRLRALRIRRRKPNRLSRDTEELRNTDIAHCTLETRANLAHAQSGVRAFVGMIQPGLSEWKSTSPISAWNVGAGEGNRTLVFSLEGCCSTIELHPRSPITYHAGSAASTSHGPVLALNRPAFAAYIDVSINNERR